MKSTILIGTGNMAIDYCKVLNALNCDFTVVGRGKDSAKHFEIKTGITPVTGGIRQYLEHIPLQKDTSAIIATGTESLMQCVLELVNAGVENILVEKPGAISIEELLAQEDRLNHLESIFVAYNRRFYASVLEAKKIIEEDGGLLSMHFEFTEWAHKIEPLIKAAGVKENWFFANSTHVIDTAFYLAGIPADWKTYSKTGEITWHKKTNFSGAGITEKGVLFSYLSNWESAGRWSIELMTNKRRIYLKPLEEVFIQKKGSIAVEPHVFDNNLDTRYKPGLYLQIKDFLNLQSLLLNMKDHIQACKNIYKNILN